MRNALLIPFAALTLALLLQACGGDDDATATATTSPSSVASVATSLATRAQTATEKAALATTARAIAAATTPGAGKVNANTATAAQIQAGLEAAGVPSAAQWTREVLEYRPYPASDANFAKLRQELAKYNPGPGVVDKIVGALVP